MIDTLLLKIISIISLTVGVYAFGFAPLLLGNRVNKAYLSLMSSLSGGILVGTTFIHLIPEVTESATKFKCQLGWSSSYPIGELLVCIGFILVVLVEKCSEEYEHSLNHHPHVILSHEDEEEDMVHHDHADHDHVGHFSSLLEEKHGLGAYILVLALSLHSILEGVAIGLADNPQSTLTLFISVIVHEVCLAFALGLKLYQDNKSLKQFCIALSIFVISCPVGITLGMIILNIFTAGTLVVVVFVMKALATGTFLQVTFLEIITPEFRHREVNQVSKVLAMAIGLALIAALMQLMHNFGASHCPETGLT